jgi:prepilin-type N-terminal cleavage/methylation domain-containing protein
MMHASRPRRGMTLMELVIGLAITGMAAAAGAAAFGSIIDHRKIIKDANVSAERASALRETIRDWVAGGNLYFQSGGGPRGMQARNVAAPRGAANLGNSLAQVTPAQAAGDEVQFTTNALNPSLQGSARIRLYVDADVNTPEKGLTIEVLPSGRPPMMRRMLDSTIDTLIVEMRDFRTGRWFPSSQVATISPTDVRITMRSSFEHSPIISVPIIFNVTSTTVQNFNTRR